MIKLEELDIIFCTIVYLKPKCSYGSDVFEPIVLAR